MSSQELLGRLIRQEPAEQPLWAALWRRLDRDEVSPTELAAVLTAASLPGVDGATLVGFVRSLQAPADRTTVPGESVNIVGTGGGPRTFNVSTASALVAAAAGAHVVKTGSRGYSSAVGATEIVERAGFPVAKSNDDIRVHTQAHRIAFTGHQVYPAQLVRIARRIVPLGMRSFGAFLNQVGPFLADVPVTAQLTGVSASFRMSQMSRLVQVVPGREITLVSSQCGIDELVSCSRSLVVHPDGEVRVIEPGEFATGDGGLADLAPVDPERAVEHLAEVVDGRACRTATATVVLNAALLLQLAGCNNSFRDAVDTAQDTIASGLASSLMETLAARTVASGV
ncbi:hypothetical protein [Flexivirga meconopsidis]|uniref:hypothetical protein n=1 Tax=Flexivirga meconopsidis TaxID=2977121 RepID=UPI00223EE40F|nr:hypothetical protein [Flexivirga meconopsidis]